MLNERQSGKLRLCLILLITAAVTFAACTAIGTLMARNAKKVPLSIPIPADVLEDRALRNFTDKYRANLGDEEFPQSVEQFFDALGSYRSTLASMRTTLESLRAQAEKANANLAEGQELVTVEQLIERDSRFSSLCRQFLGLQPETAAPAAKAEAAEEVMLDDEESAAPTPTPAPTPAPMTADRVETALREMTAITDAANRTFAKSVARTELVNLDWAAVIEARLGLPVPPDWMTRDTNRLFDDQRYERTQQLEWDLAEADPEREPVGDRPEVKAAPVWWSVIFGTAVLLGLAALWFALRFAEKGKKLGAVLCASCFALLALPLAVVRLWAHIDIVRSCFDWQSMAGVVGYVAAALLIIAFYAYAYTAHRAKSRKLALAVLALGALTVIGLGVRNVMPILAVMKRSDILTGDASLAFILLNAGRLLLWLFAAAAIVLGVRRSDDRAPAAEPSMFPALDAYRVSLRKERA